MNGPTAPPLQSSVQGNIDKDGNGGSIAPSPSLCGIGDRDHVVHFYKNEASLLDYLVDFVATALKAGDNTLIIATPRHRQQLAISLKPQGIVAGQMLRQKRLVELDASETLAKFMVDDWPDKERFIDVVGGAISRIVAGTDDKSSHLAAFGEMVALLWADGKYDAAVYLEQLWNDLAQTYSFSLLCAYPQETFKDEIHGRFFEDICESHSRILPADSYSVLRDELDRIREIARFQQKAQALETELIECRRGEQQRHEAEAALRQSEEELRILHEVGALLASELDLKKVVQAATDAARHLSGAEFGAFFYNAVNQDGEKYFLYTLSGAPYEAFAKYPMPRNSALFAPTFAGERTIRLEDVLKDPNYGKTAPYYGMPPGHLPVRSYLAVPVTSRSGEVLGGLFYGHSEPGVFTERAERLVEGVAKHAAIALDNAQLYQRAQDEIAQRKQIETALRASEERFRSIFEQTACGIAQTDITGRFILVNDYYCEIVGRPRAELMNLRMQDIMHAEDLPDAVSFAVLSEERAPLAVENRYVRPDGSHVWVRNHLSAARYGNVDLILSAITDITAGKQAEQVKARLAAVVEHSDDAIITKDLNGIITTWNRGAMRIFGYTAEEVIGRPVTILMPPDRVNEEPGILERIRRGENIDHYETVRRRKDGTLLDISLTVSPIRDGQGRITGASKIARDVSANKKAQEALRQSEERFRTFMNATSDVIYRMSPDWAEMRYLDGKEFIEDQKEPNRTWLVKYIPPDDHAYVMTAIQKAIRTRSNFELEYRVLRPDGSLGWTFSRAIPILDDSGQIIEWFGTAADITARKLSEEALRINEERLRKVEKLAAAGQLAASFAHEINNPLSSVTNVLYLLEGSELPQDSKALVQTAASELARVSRIVKQSLSYYRVGSVPKVEDLGNIVEESLQVFAEKIQRAQIQMRKQITPGTLVLGFAGEIRQVIDNLILNAVEAMRGGGCLTISVRTSYNWNTLRPCARFTVADNGCGMSKEHLSRAFEPFFTTKQEKGTGLGLWVVRGIVAKHDGYIGIRSRDDAAHSGTVISIRWPSAG
ncbi:MAG TPA: PAS domain S-box protein [Alloacidobacterium sp.]|nr:PAS domain S-box protein [Alloacidobacterium sp.]